MVQKVGRRSRKGKVTGREGGVWNVLKGPWWEVAMGEPGKGGGRGLGQDYGSNAQGSGGPGQVGGTRGSSATSCAAVGWREKSSKSGREESSWEEVRIKQRLT